MNAAYIILGLVLGGFLVWLWLRGKAGREIAVLQEKVATLEPLKQEITQRDDEITAMSFEMYPSPIIMVRRFSQASP